MNDFVGAPRPRVLAVGLTEKELEQIKPLAGSLRVTENPYSEYPEEHDVLVMTDGQFHDAANLFNRRLTFAPPVVTAESGMGVAIMSSGFGSTVAPFTKSTIQTRPALQLEVTAFATELGLASLVRRSCIPSEGHRYAGFRLPVHPYREAHVLLQERLDRPMVLAAILEDADELSGETDSVFWLPDIARAELIEWVQQAFAWWRQAEPEMFPQTAEWARSEEWAAPDELVARAGLAEFELAETQRLEQVEVERRKLGDALENAVGTGEGWRVLLSGTGDELAAAVRESLELLGFTVADSDELPQHKGKKREDLRVTDANWVALVEVKGYTGAAKSNDLYQLGAAATAYASHEKGGPDALWYVVNTFREIDPSQRPTALADRSDDLQAFADSNGGCLIDTRDLFVLRQRVALGKLDPADARSLLRSASHVGSGRFSVTFEGEDRRPGSLAADRA
ncbi:hypothetical protein ACIRCZ_18820 [Leifsonia sp. NPDC102414]|uniref:hypothetical protein n=1 Tax=Leifsonia sp. NPDC102414 TaxID=3364124 RepID=UPI00382651B4